MSDDRAIALASTLRAATLEQLWRQWQAIGATVTSGGRTASAIVDPEALLLMSLWMQPSELRLVDVMESWIEVNSKLLGIQRIQNLMPQFPASIAQGVSRVAEVGFSRAKDARWRSLRKRGEELPQPRGGKTRSVSPRFDSWPTILLQLRQGMGVGAKADVLAFLLGAAQEADWWSVASVAEVLSYTPTAVRRVADDLAAARFILRPGTRGPERGVQRLYGVDAEPWTTLLRISPHGIGWGYWRERFLFVVEALTWLEAQEQRSISGYAADVASGDLLQRHAAVFLRNRIYNPPEFEIAEHGLEFLSDAVQRLIGWMQNQG